MVCNLMMKEYNILIVDLIYLNVHGTKTVGWALYACEWAAQLDGYFNQETAWNWHKTLLNTGYYILGAMRTNELETNK